MKLRTLLVLIAVAILAMGSCSYFMTYGTEEVITVTVTDTDTKRGGSGDIYLVDVEGETFQNVDTILYWKWNSTDIQRELKQATGPVTIRVYGWRIPMFTTYRNIVEIVKDE